jgi:hypothetical protein
MSKFLQATNLTWSDSTATSVFQNCPVIHCVNMSKNENPSKQNGILVVVKTVPYLNTETGNRRLNIVDGMFSLEERR